MDLDLEEYGECDEGYARRSALYGNIYDALGLHDWELDNQTEKYEQMAFSGIYRPIQMLMLSAKARAYMKKWDAGMSRLLDDMKMEEESRRETPRDIPGRFCSFNGAFSQHPVEFGHAGFRIFYEASHQHSFQYTRPEPLHRSAGR